MVAVYNAIVGTANHKLDAEALFRRFAERHGLRFEPRASVHMEVWWTFPVQPGLSTPITLGLQNLDELNFGVDEFWSSFFPFDRVPAEFERVIDAWVDGRARVAVTGRHTGRLQLREGGRWTTVYSAEGCLSLFRRRPKGFLINQSGPPKA